MVVCDMSDSFYECSMLDMFINIVDSRLLNDI